MRAGIRFALWLGFVMAAGATFPADGIADPVVEVASRGQAIRALLLRPERPRGSVVLLAGGLGRLDITPDGTLRALRYNQLVRTRHSYAAAGYATLVPDVTPDLKTADGAVRGYRWAAEHGADLAALVAYMRTISEPVVVVATSRGAVSAGTLLREGTGAGRPDGMVLTAPMLMPTEHRQPSFHSAVRGDPEVARLPLLVVGHVRDTCRVTLPSSILAFRQWHGGAVDVILMDGPEGTGDPCEARAAHGFAGLDAEVVERVTRWIAGVPAR